MKKILIFLLFSALLVACDENATDKNEVENSTKTENVSGESENNQSDPDVENVNLSEEVNTFVKSFNNLASVSDDVETIDNIEEIVEGVDESTQVLYSSTDYGIIAIYDNDGSLSRYSIVISQEQPYEELKGSGLNAMLHIGEALELDYEKLEDKFEETLAKESDVYFEGDYTVMFFNHKISGTSDWGMVIEFVKH